MASTTIEWTEATWNPVTGCTRVSAGCANCYAERMAKRLQAMGQGNYADGFKVTTHRHALDMPLRWKKPRMIFVNSMSDLFHEKVPKSFIKEIFSVMREANQHTYQVLTKRSARLAEFAGEIDWPANVWMGVSVENRASAFRIDHLRKVPAHVRFLSMEPLLEGIPDLNLDGIEWVIVGGESGPGAREMKEEWVHDIRNQCRDAGTLFFFKQWGGVNKKKNGRLLGGKLYNEMPSELHSASL